MRAFLRRLFAPLWAFLFAEDVYVSYSRADERYARSLMAAVRERRNVTFCFDQDSAPADRRLPRSLVRQLDRSRVLLLIGTNKAVNSPNVRREVRRFAIRSRPVVPVNVAGALGDALWRTRPWVWISGAQRVAHEPLSDVVDRILGVMGFLSRTRRLGIASAAAAVLLTVAAGAIIVAQRQVQSASTAAAVAEWNRKVSISNSLDAAMAARMQNIGAAAASMRAVISRADALLAGDRARQEAARARASQLAGQAINQIGTLYHRDGLRLAVEAYDTLPDEPAYAVRSALLKGAVAFPGLRRVMSFPGEQIQPWDPRGVQVLDRIRNGHAVLAGFGDGAVRVIDAATQRVTFTADAGSSVTAVAASPSGSLLAAAGGDSLLLWRPGSPKPVGRIRVGYESVRALRFVGATTLLVAGVAPGGSSVSLEKAKEETHFIPYDVSDPAHPVPVGSGRIPAVDLARNCPLTAQKVLCYPEGRQMGAVVTDASFSLDGKWGAVGLGDGRVAVINMAAKTVRRCLHAALASIRQVVVAPDDNQVLFADEAGAVATARLDSDDPPVADCSTADRFVFSSDGKRLAFLRRDAIDLSEGDRKLGNVAYAGGFQAFDFLDAAGMQLIAGGIDGSITWWDLGNLEPFGIADPWPITPILAGDARTVAFSPDGRHLFVGIGEERFDRIVDVASRTVTPLPLPAGMRNAPPVPQPERYRWRDKVPVALSGDLTTAAYAVVDERNGRNEYSVFIRDLASGTTIRRIPSRQGLLRFALSHDGRTLAIATPQAVIVDGPAIHRQLPISRTFALAVSPRGDLLAVDATGGTTLWDVQAGLPLATLPKYWNVAMFAFSPDGSRLAIADRKAVVLWTVDLPAMRNGLSRMAGGAER